MARIVWKEWVAVDGLSNDAAKGAIREIGAARLELGKAGDAKAQREIKSIADKWAKKHPCNPECAPGATPKANEPKSGTKPKAEAPKSKPAPKADAPKSKAEAPKADAPKSRAAPKAEAPRSKADAPKSKPAPKADAPKSKPAPKSKAASSPKPAPKSEQKPKKAEAKTPKSKPAPKSKAASSPKPAPKSEQKPKKAEAKTPKPKAEAKAPKSKKPKTPNVTAAKVKELRAALADKLAELRVSCPGERARLVDDAAAALATARAVAQVSPEVRRARNELQAALTSFAGYEAAKAAIAAAEKSVPAREAKAHVKAVIAEQVGERERQILEDAEKDPRVVAARAELAAARTPEAVQKATEKLASARDTCRRSARNLRETYGGAIDNLRAVLAQKPVELDPSALPAAMLTAEELLLGPRTARSGRAA